MEVFMEKAKKSYFTAKNVTYLAVLLALVIVLQVWGGSIKIGATSLSFVLVPIVLGGVLLGIGAGAILGFAFGFIVLMYGVTGADPFTALLFSAHPVITSFLCLIKGTAAGAVSGLLYKLISVKNKYVAVFVASAAAPVVNTGLFIIGALFMGDFITQTFVPDGETLMYFLVIGCAGINFLVEFAINIILSPAIFTVNNVLEKQLRRSSHGYSAKKEHKTQKTDTE